MIADIVGAVVLLWFAVGAYVFCRACCRVKELPWLDRAALAKTDFGKYSDSIDEAYRYLKSHQARDVWINSEDGLKLHGLWLQADDAVGTMLLVHGYHSTFLVDFGAAITSYHAQGLNLLIPDQRSHGKSEGRFSTFGIKESKDMLSWLEFMNRELWDGPVVISGMSMGATTVMYMAGDQIPENVHGIIADCGFSSPGDIIGKVFTDVTHLPAKPWIYSAEICARILAGFSFWERSTIEAMRKNKLPVFLVHGMDDDFVPCGMTRKVYDSCGGEKELLLVVGAGHGVSYLKDKMRYTAGVRRVLRKAFGEPYELRNN